MSEYGTMDSTVLGQVLLLQSTLQAAPDEERLGNMVVHGVSNLPGVCCSRLCIEGTEYAAGNLDECLLPTCQVKKHFPDAPGECTSDCLIESAERLITCEVRTANHSYGTLFLCVEDGHAIQPLIPFVSNTANLIALHIENMRAQIAFEESNQSLDALVQSRTSALNESTKHLEHTNRVLAAIRNINQLITHEKDCKRLLSETCQLLVETRGFYSAWIALLEENHLTGEFYHAGFKEDIDTRIADLPSRKLPRCARITLESPGVHIIKDPPSECSDCPIMTLYDDCSAMTVRLEHHGMIFGFLSVSLPSDFVLNEEEQALFAEVAEDVSFALWSIEAERHHKETEQKFATILNTTSDAVVAADTNGIITLFNPVAEHLFECKEEDAIGTHYSRFCPEELRSDQNERVQTVLQNGSMAAYEAVRITAKGHRFPVDVSVCAQYDEDGNPIGMTAFYRDITNRKKAEAELLESRERLKLALGASEAGIYRWNIHSGELYLDSRLHAMLGYAPGELPTNTQEWKTYHHPDELPELTERYHAYMRGEYSIYSSEHRLRNKAGQWIWVLNRGGVGSRDTNGEPEWFIGVSIDITAKKREERMQAAHLHMIDYAVDYPVKELLQKFIDEAEALTDSTIGFFHFVEEDKESLTLQAWSTRTLERCQAEGEGKHYPISQAGVWVDCLRSRKPVIHNDYASLPNKKGMPEGHVPVVRELVVPVIQAGRIVGILGIGNKDSDYTEADLDLIQRFADLAWETLSRKQSEDTLRQSEETYRALIQGLPDVVLRFDREARHLYVSDNIQSMTGLPAEDYTGKSHRELGFPEEVCTFCEENVRKVFETGKTLELQHTHESPHGTILFDVRAVPERDEAGNVCSVLVIGRDITEQHRAQRNYQILFEEMLNGFSLNEIICDARGTPVNYRFLAVNPAFERMAGLPAERLIGKTVLELFPETENRWIEIFGHVALTGEPATFEDYSGELNRHFRTTAFQPAPGQVACIFEDITERKESEDALRESEEKFRQIAETVHEIFWVGSLDWNEIYYINHAYEEIWGRSCKSIMDEPKSWIESIHPDDREKVSDYIEKRSVGQLDDPKIPEYRIIRSDGTLRWIQGYAYQVHDITGKAVRIVGSAEDITEKKHSEEALRISEAKYKLLIENQNDLVVQFDREDRIQFVNPKYCKTFGKTESELLGKSFMSLIHEEDQPKVSESIERVLQPPFESQHEERALTTYGWRWFSWSARAARSEDGEITSIISVGRDITDRKQAEEALRTSEQKFRSYISSAPNGIFVINQEGNFVEVNQAAETLTGYSTEELLHMHLLDMVLPEDRRYVANSFREALSTGKTSADIPILRKNGSLGYGSVEAVKLSDGRVLSFVVDITERRLAEEKLHEATEREMEVVRAGNVGLWDWNLETNDVHFSRVWKQQLGYAEDEIQDHFMEWQSRLHPDDLDRSLNEIKQCIKEARQEYKLEFRLRHKDGSWRWILAQASVIIDEFGKPLRMRGSHVDITELKKAQEAIRESEEKYRILFSSSDALVSVYDREGTCLLMNPKVAELFGGKPEDFIGKSFKDLHPDFAEQYTKHICEVIDTGIPSEHDSEVHFPTCTRWLLSHTHPVPDAHGVYRSAQIISQDITERKKAEEEIRKFKTIADQANYGCAIASLDGTIEYANPYFAEAHGYSVDEVIGFPISNFHTEEQMREVDRVHQQLFETGWYGPTELHHVHRNGKAFPMLMVGALLEDAQGKPQYITATAIDITDQKHLEDQLRQSQKMEAVGQLAGGIAHDFNNLLQAILGFAEMALIDFRDNPSTSSSIQEIIKAGDRAATLVSQLLAYSRRQVLKMENVDLNEVLVDLVMMIRRVIGEHITLNIVPGKGLGIVQADRGQMSQILTNLCVNARDAMPEGGTITIKTENVHINEEFCQEQNWARPGHFVLLSLTDSGSGMNEEMIHKIFEPFFTTKEVGKGTGLGLSTVYGLIRQHEGLIHVTSKLGQGTTFNLYFPIVEESVTITSTKVEGPLPEGSETILLAEDDKTVRNLTKTILERAGYTVFTAIDGNDAVRVFHEHADDIQLVLLDVIMPGLSGRAVYDEIQKTHPDIRAIFASGYSMDVIHTNFVLDEGVTLIQKPCPRDILLRKIREILDA